MIHKNSIATHKWQLSCTGRCMSSLKKLLISIVILVYIKCPMDGQKFLVAVALETEAKLDKKRGTVNGNTVASTNPFTQVEETGRFEKQDLRSLRGSKDMDSAATITEIKDILKLQVASYPDASLPKDMMEYVPALNSFRTHPSRNSSDLPDDAFDTAERGIEAAGKIADIVASFSNSETTTSPRDVIELFASVADTIGVFIPQFALVGSALGIFSQFFPEPEAEPDPMLVYLDERFSAIQRSLDKVIAALGGLQLFFCEQDLDADIKRYISPYETSYNIYRNPAESDGIRLAERMTIEDRCLRDGPVHLMTNWNDMVQGNIRLTSDCRTPIETDSANRVLYFQKHWVGTFLKTMLKAAQYQGMCYGILSSNPTISDASIYAVSDADTLITTMFNDMHATFQEMEARMYESTPSQWKKSLEDHYEDDIDSGDPNKIFNALATDFFPDFKYAVGLITPAPDGSNFVSFGPGDSKFGSFVIGRMVVMYRASSDTTTLPRLEDGWTNLNCPGMSMCMGIEESCTLGFINCHDVCATKNCNHVWHEIRENLRDNNPRTYKLFVERRAVAVKSASSRRFCASYNRDDWCQSTDTVDESASTITFVGDPIYESFKKSEEYEGSRDSGETSQYMIVGVSGHFPHDVPISIWDNPAAPDSHGMYFEFDENKWNTAFGPLQNSGGDGNIVLAQHWREGNMLWAGNVKVWRAGAMGFNPNNSFGRREGDTRYNANFQDGDELIRIQYDIPISVWDNPNLPDSHGMYFEFDENKWNTTFGPLQNSGGDGNIVLAQHWREGNILWRGNLMVWRAGATVNNPNRSIGRREGDTRYNANFQDGDELITFQQYVPISIWDNPTAPDSHGMYFEFDENEWNIAFGLLQNSGGDGNIVLAQHWRANNMLWAGNVKVWRAEALGFNPNNSVGRREGDTRYNANFQDGDELVAFIL